LVADYQIVTNVPKVRITETQGLTKVVEGGLYDTYQVVLDTVPTANVSVTVTPNAQVDIGNGAGVASVLLFTPTNALTPQTIVVTAPIDGIAEGTHTGLITQTSSSADGDYNGLLINDVTVSIIDREAPVIVINELDSDTPSMPVNDSQEFVELYDGGVGNVSLSGKSLVFFNGNGSSAYRVIDLTGQSTNGNGFLLVGNPSVPGAAVTFPNSGLQNGQDAVALYSGLFPSGGSVTTANLLDAVVYSANGATDGAGLFVLLNSGQSNVDENANSNVVNDAIARRPDGGTPRQTSTYVAQAPTPGTFNQPIPGGVQFVQSAGRVDVVEGGAADSYQIALTSIPTANVVITVDPDNQTNLGAGAGVAIMLTFTPANALIPQLIPVAAINDGLGEGAHSSTITHTAASGDARYNGLVISNVVANITEPAPLAGDYNSNGVVDAADYVLWRNTLGSTTILAADGSGSSSGVPNGVVDQADYTFWRSRFGSTSGSGAGESASIVETAFAGFESDEVKPARGLKSIGSIPALSEARSARDNLLLVVSTVTRERTGQMGHPSAGVADGDEAAVDAIFANLFDGVALAI
jgi:hypothetical protein